MRQLLVTSKDEWTYGKIYLVEPARIGPHGKAETYQITDVNDRTKTPTGIVFSKDAIDIVSTYWSSARRSKLLHRYYIKRHEDGSFDELPFCEGPPIDNNNLIIFHSVEPPDGHKHCKKCAKLKIPPADAGSIPPF